MRRRRYHPRTRELLGYGLLAALFCAYVRLDLLHPARVWETRLILVSFVVVAALLIPRRLIDTIRLARLRELAARYAPAPVPAGYRPLDHATHLESPWYSRDPSGRRRNWHRSAGGEQ